MGKFVMMMRSASARRNKDSNGMNINIVKLKVVVQRLQKLLYAWLLQPSNYNKDPPADHAVNKNGVITGGHFSVIAFEQDQGPKRMVLPLEILKHEQFLCLLEKAADEYGFEYQGALIVPCSVMELERILQLG